MLHGSALGGGGIKEDGSKPEVPSSGGGVAEPSAAEPSMPLPLLPSPLLLGSLLLLLLSSAVEEENLTTQGLGRGLTGTNRRRRRLA